MISKRVKVSASMKYDRKCKLNKISQNPGNLHWIQFDVLMAMLFSDSSYQVSGDHTYMFVGSFDVRVMGPSAA